MKHTSVVIILILLVAVSGCLSGREATLESLRQFDGGEVIDSIIEREKYSGEVQHNIALVSDEAELESFGSRCGPYFKLQPHYVLKIEGKAAKSTVLLDATDKKVDCLVTVYPHGEPSRVRTSSSLLDLNQSLLSDYSQNYRDFLEVLSGNMTVMTWWDLGQFIRHFSDAKSVAAFISEEGRTSVAEVVAGVAFPRVDDPPYESSQKTADVALFLVTENKSEALCIAKKYNATHAAVSSDLIGKIYWLRKFAYGRNDFSADFAVHRIDLLRTGLSERTYASDDIGGYRLFVKHNTTGDDVDAYYRLRSKELKIQNILFYGKDGLISKTNPVADFNGTLLVDFNNATAIYMPPEVDSSIFAELFFFDGENLPKFELEKTWGSEIKLFRINYPESLACS